jgi:hypothetical protein
MHRHSPKGRAGIVTDESEDRDAIRRQPKIAAAHGNVHGT